MSAVNDILTAIQRIIPSLNTSNAGLFSRIAQVVGSFIDIVRLEMLRSEQTVQQATKIARITTQQYYVDRAYAYQSGDRLVVIDPATQELGYATIDETKQIIKQASIGTVSLGIFNLNVATADANNNIIPLTTAQLTAFRNYYLNFRAVGVDITVASNAPAIFTATNLYIRYYKTFNLDDVKQRITKALHDIQVTRRTSNILYINEVETALNNLEGIRDAYFNEVRITNGASTVVPEDGKVVLETGYFNFDPNLYDYSKTLTTFEAV